MKFLLSLFYFLLSVMPFSGAFCVRNAHVPPTFATSTTIGKTNRKTALWQTHPQVDDYRDGIRVGRHDDSEDYEASSRTNSPVNVVMKFGGSSLADASRVDHVANLIKGQVQEGYFPRAVVCSGTYSTASNFLGTSLYTSTYSDKSI